MLYMSFCNGLQNGIFGCNTDKEEGLGPTSLCITNGTIGYSMGAYNDTVNPFRKLQFDSIVCMVVLIIIHFHLHHIMFLIFVVRLILLWGLINHVICIPGKFANSTYILTSSFELQR